ncbi:MAG: 5'-nucleotidase C-terminal domain-containing protein [Prevotella sp.]|nr:5'-nucleotidase C-terminal domain-containing protein [Prevotella sp.]
MKKIFIACSMALFGILPLTAKQKAKTVTLRIVQTTDVHGSFFPYDFINRKPKRGSLARVSSYVNRLRSEHGDRVILLDNGDILQGQPTCYYYNFVNTEATNIAADVINYLKYDAQTIGNHDVEPGHAVYDKWIREVNCPMLGANVVDAQTGKPYLKPYTILNRDGVRIAIFGLLTPAIPNWLTEDTWSGLRFDDMTATAHRWMKHLKENEKPDVVIGLFHSGKDGGIVTDKYEEDAALRIAREVPGFDIIFFGHDHTRFQETITNVEGKPVLCLNPANNATAVADAQINLSLRKGKVVGKTISGKLVDIVDEPIDETYMAHFQPQIEQVNGFVNRKIGEFKSTINTPDSYFGNSSFCDFILNLQLQITGADIAFNAPLSFNASIHAGDVFVGDMFNLYKFENQLFVMRLTGEEIRRHLEMSYDQWVNTMQSPDDHLLLLSERTIGDQQRLGFKNFYFNFDSAAGIDYEVDVTKPDGQKVSILRMSNGEPFDEAKWYKVAVNSYRGNGGGELLTRGAGIPRDSLDSRVIWRSERDQRYYLMQEIEKLQVVDPQPNQNWRFVPEEWVKPAAERDRKLLFGK